MSEVDKASVAYLLGRNCDPQWKGVLRALAHELNAQMPAAELHKFFHVVGARYARSAPLGVDGSILELEAAVNQFCAQHGWGWTHVDDRGTALEFVHCCAPLREAFGDEAMSWSPGLLQGLYAEWIKQLGAGDALELRQVGQAEGPWDAVRFRLARAGSV